MLVVLALATGALAFLSRVINAALAVRVRSLPGSLVNHVVGTLGAGALLIVGVRTGAFHLAPVPPVYLIGGCLGVLVVAASNYAAARIGIVLLSMLLLAFQLLTSAAIDHYAWLGAERLPLTPRKGLGLLLLIAGALLVLTERPKQDAPHPPGVPGPQPTDDQRAAG